MLGRRRSDEADGERRIMGSERFEDTVEEIGFEVFAAGRAASEADFAGIAPGLELEEGMPFRRPRKVSACLRTCEKSCRASVGCAPTIALSTHTVGLIPLRRVLWSPILLSPL